MAADASTSHGSAPSIYMDADNESFIMYGLNLLSVWALTALSAYVLELPYPLFAISVAGSLSGAAMLAYLRRDALRKETLMKVGASTLGGVFIGGYICSHWEVIIPPEVAAIHFVTSLSIIVALRTMLDLFETNSVLAIQKLINWVTGSKLGDKLKGKKDGIVERDTR